MLNRRSVDRPSSWALSDDILDRNIDQLDRETPRCNLSEEEEEELQRNKLAIEAQNATQSPPVPSSCISKSWMPGGRGKDTTPKPSIPVGGFNPQAIPTTGSPYMKRVTREQKAQGTSQEPREANFPSSGVALTTTSSQSKRMGYASPTLAKQSSNAPMTSHISQHAMHSHNTSQQHSKARLPSMQSPRGFPNVPISSPNSSGLSQGKPLGMVTPQLPNKMQSPKVVVSPQSSSQIPSSSQYTASIAAPRSTKKPTSSTTSQTVAVAPQQKQQQKPGFQSNQQTTQQPPFQQVRSFQGDPRHHLAYCHVPDCKGCRETKNWSDDPTRKAQLIRQVEDEILLRSRELDSCWQEDELDCVRDFTDMDRRKEMTYAETSEEGIYKRVSDEIIKRPPIWHDDEVDSVKDFSKRKCQEGEQSKIGSEEKVCLSPPWNEEDESLLTKEGVVMVHGITATTTNTSSQPITTSVTSEEIDATVTMSNYKMIQDEADSVKDYTSYNDGQELGSRIPSSERISFSPPWTPSGCHTPAEGVPLLATSNQESQPTAQADQSQNPVVATKQEASVACGDSTSSSIDTSMVKLRDKSKRGRAAEKVPFVVPRFDDLEEDQVTDFSAPERKLQGLNAKIPSYEFITFTPPWISSNSNSGIQTPQEYQNELSVPNVTPLVTSSSSMLTPASSAQTPANIPQPLATTNPQALPPALPLGFRADGHYDDAVYGDHNATVDSLKNFSVGLIEETSRIPSSEQLCFTPPWIETEEGNVERASDASGVQSKATAQELTLEEQRAIEEEARKTGVEEAEAKAKEQRNAQTEDGACSGGQDGAVTGPPGRDSGFCSEQDQKLKQQEQESLEIALPDNTIDKVDDSYDERQIIDHDKNDPDESPNHCWSSKESSGSNQTDISTVVNPATSVPITAPGSPDPNGSEASDDAISESEANETGEAQISSGQDAGPENTPAVSQSDPLTAKDMGSSQQSQFVHHGQSFSYTRAALQQGNALPSHQSYPRLQQANMHYHTGSFDASQHQGFKESQAIGHLRPHLTYQDRPEFANERPRMPVPPYVDHFEGKGELLGSIQGQLGAEVHYGGQSNANIHYKGQQPMLRQPVPHQMHQQIGMQHVNVAMGHYGAQRSYFHSNQGPSYSYHPSFEFKGQMPRGTGQSQPGQIRQGQMSQGQMVQSQMSQGQMSQGQMPQNQVQKAQMVQGQMSKGLRPQVQMSQGQTALGQLASGLVPPNPIPGMQMQQSQKMPVSQTSRQQQQYPHQHLDAILMHGMMEERYCKVMQQGLQNMMNMETGGMNEEKNQSSNQGHPRSVSQLNIHTAQEHQKNADNASVVSFSSVAASHQNLDTKVDMVSSLLSMLGTHDKDDVARTLLAMSSSTDSCSAMRQSGCLPLLIKLLHDPEYEVKGINWEARRRAGLALHNIISSGTVDRKGRREVRVLRLIEIVRAHSEAVLSGNMDKYHAHKSAPALRDHGPGPAVAALMKLSFEEEHKNTITELGGLQVIAELLKVDSTLNGHCKDPYSITLRKYAGMALINLTYSESRDKNALLEIRGSLKAIIDGLTSTEEEDLVQVSAGILRNVSWKTDDNGKKTLAELKTAQNLMTAVQHISSEAAIRSVLSAVWNLSAHSPENKEGICSTPGSLKFLCYALNYRSPTRSLVIPENAGGIMRNISSHIAVKPEYRQVLREHGCLKILISHLRSPSTRIVSNSCGILWNLSARCIEDQELLWELGAVSMLKTLLHSKHKSISKSSASALRNLMAVKPGSSSTDNESHASVSFRRSNTLPGKSRSLNSQMASARTDRKYKSFFGKKQSAKDVPHTGAESLSLLKKASNRGFPNVPEDSRKVHRKLKHGEPHFYADLYQDPPRRGITMPQAKDPTVVLYSSENAQSAQEGVREDIPIPYNGSRVERWNNLHGGSQCNCKSGAFTGNSPQGVEGLQKGMRGMTIEEESPIIARQRLGSSSSSLSSCSPPSQPIPRINNENSPMSIFRERKSNPGLCLHRRSMSDTISEFGHPSLGQRPLHAVTDSELAKPSFSEFNSAGFRKDEHFSWYNSVQKQPIAKKNAELSVEREKPKVQYRNIRMMKGYDEVACYETHFLSPYDDCPLSAVKDSVHFPHFSLGYRPKQDVVQPESTTPKIFVQETRYDVRQALQRRSNETIASSIQSSREDLVNRCKHNHSGTNVWQCDCYETENVWIRKVKHKKMSQDQSQRPEGQRSDGQRIESQRHEGQRLEGQRSENQRIDSQRYEGQRTEGQRIDGQRYEGQRTEGQRIESQRTECQRMDGQWVNQREDQGFKWVDQKPPGWPESQRRDNPWQGSSVSNENVMLPQTCSYPMTHLNKPKTGSKCSLRYDDEFGQSKEQINTHDGDIQTISYYDNDNVFLGNDKWQHRQEKIISSPHGQFGIATPMKDPHLRVGQGLDAQDVKSRDQCMSGDVISRDKSAVVNIIPSGSETNPKPLRSSLKSPSDGIRYKFRKKHITQKVITSGEKKKAKAKDNVMVTSL